MFEFPFQVRGSASSQEGEQVQSTEWIMPFTVKVQKCSSANTQRFSWHAAPRPAALRRQAPPAGCPRSRRARVASATDRPSGAPRAAWSLSMARRASCPARGGRSVPCCWRCRSSSSFDQQQSRAARVHGGSEGRCLLERFYSYMFCSSVDLVWVYMSGSCWMCWEVTLHKIRCCTDGSSVDWTPSSLHVYFLT